MTTKRIVYKISPKADHWLLTGSTGWRELLTTQRECIGRARWLCAEHGKAGVRTQIRLCGRNGRIRREWTYPRASDPKGTKG